MTRASTLPFLLVCCVSPLLRSSDDALPEKRASSVPRCKPSAFLGQMCIAGEVKFCFPARETVNLFFLVSGPR
uniref:Putative secreted protein n=1 Tax=Ixodes ricinus TaxID=34613 RepID=A0A147BQ01_IXORI